MVHFLVAIVRELIVIAERFACALMTLLSAGIILGVFFGSPSPWVFLAVAVIGVLLYGEFCAAIERLDEAVSHDTTEVFVGDARALRSQGVVVQSWFP